MALLCFPSADGLSKIVNTGLYWCHCAASEREEEKGPSAKKANRTGTLSGK